MDFFKLPTATVEDLLEASNLSQVVAIRGGEGYSLRELQAMPLKTATGSRSLNQLLNQLKHKYETQTREYDFVKNQPLEVSQSLLRAIAVVKKVMETRVAHLAVEEQKVKLEKAKALRTSLQRKAAINSLEKITPDDLETMTDEEIAAKYGNVL